MSKPQTTTAHETNTTAYHVDEQFLQQILSELTVAKAKLNEGRARTITLLNSLGEGLIVTNEHGQITTVNSYALNCLGYTEEELVGKWLPKTIIATDRDAKPLRQMDRPSVKALSTGRIISDFTHYLSREGNAIPVRVTVSPIMASGIPMGAIEVFQDLTREQQLDLAKDEFVSLASHQLRTPATGMKSILSMLAGGDFGPLTQLQQKYLDKAISTNDRQIQIIEGLLNVALVDAGKLELDLDFSDLSELLKECIQEQQEILTTRDQQLESDIDPQITLPIDVHKARMIIDNLLSNASKYSRPGGRIRVSLHTSPGFAELTVSDDGVGIPACDMPKLFNKFQRLDNELSATVGGTGLGLFLTKSLIELHGGSINVHSRENAGSTFVVRLPQKMSYHHV